MKAAALVLLCQLLYPTTTVKGDDLTECPALFRAWDVDHPSACTGMDAYSILDFISYIEDLCPCNFPIQVPTVSDLIIGDQRQITVGPFTQGSPIAEPCRDNTYEEAFSHTLTKDFYIMETEVSRQMWLDLKALQPSLASDPTCLATTGGLDHPVQCLTWSEALLFANLLSMQLGFDPCYFKDEFYLIVLDGSNYSAGQQYYDDSADGFRLPVEGEWEYAARADSITPFSTAGINYNVTNCDTAGCTLGTLPILESIAWFCANKFDVQGNNTSKPSGLKEPNPWGLNDMHGNVWEYCWDDFSVYPVGAQTDYRSDGNPSSSRAIRGGSWFHGAHFCRSASRTPVGPGARGGLLGFRLVRNVP